MDDTGEQQILQMSVDDSTNDNDVFRGKGPLRVNMRRGKKFETSRNYRVEKKNIENQCLPKLSKRRLFWGLRFPLRTLEWMIQMIYIIRGKDFSNTIKHNALCGV